MIHQEAQEIQAKKAKQKQIKVQLYQMKNQKQWHCTTSTIKEASANNLSDTSQEAQEIQEAKKHKQKQIKVKLYQMKNQKQWH